MFICNSHNDTLLACLSSSVVWFEPPLGFSFRSSKEVPITVASRSKAWTGFARSNTGLVDSIPTWGMDICVYVYYVFVLSCVQVATFRRVDPLSRSLTVCVKDKEADKESRVQKRAVEPLMNEWMNEWRRGSNCQLQILRTKGIWGRTRRKFS
jgi:hypothetical protein